MAEISQVACLLADRAQAVCEHLLPNGRREGHEWRIGSLAGEPGQSLGIRLTGDKAGIWSDFNGGASGDLLDLWAGVKRVPLATALDEARAWPGLERPALQPPVEPTWTRPPKPPCPKPPARGRDYPPEDRKERK